MVKHLFWQTLLFFVLVIFARPFMISGLNPQKATRLPVKVLALRNLVFEELFATIFGAGMGVLLNTDEPEITDSIPHQKPLFSKFSSDATLNSAQLYSKLEAKTQCDRFDGLLLSDWQSWRNENLAVLEKRVLFSRNYERYFDSTEIPAFVCYLEKPN